MKRTLVRLVVAGAVLVGSGIAAALAWSPVDVRVTASSAAPDSDLDALPAGDGRGAWRSDGETVGAWVQVAWSSARVVDRVRLRGPRSSESGLTSAVLTFDDGSSLHVTPDEAGDVVVDFPARRIAAARLTVAAVADGADSVTLSTLVVDGSGNPGPDGSSPGTPTASSTHGPGVSALVDGNAGVGEGGLEWAAGADDRRPWVQLTWPSPRELASVQILGPSGTHVDPSNSAAAPLHGTLRFGDGSRVVVSGIAGGGDGPTTIAFAPRMTTSVRLELIGTGSAALREFTAFTAGTTPPRWPASSSSAGYSATAPPAGSCDRSTPAVGSSDGGGLSLVCPAPGSAVDGWAVVVVAAAPGTDLRATAWRPDAEGGSGAPGPVAAGTAGADGRAVLDIDTSRLARGPVTVQVTAPGGAGDADTALSVQLVNRVGRVLASPGFAPAGMTLQWDEQFTEPLSVSADGRGAAYAAIKPEPGGSSQFGDAVFADPTDGAGTLATVDGEYLRIRAEPIGDRAVDTSWGQRHLAGLLSSLRVGASGFGAQYGYFEARMTGAPGRGSWPAFWMLNTEAAGRASGRAAEVDAVELYGQFPRGSCHTVHSWDENVDEQDGEQLCQESNGFSDWTMTWHTYGVRIVPGGAVFLIDGVQVAAFSGLTHTEEPFFFLLDLALGGGWPVDLSATGDTTDLYVDWVRVYT